MDIKVTCPYCKKEYQLNIDESQLEYIAECKQCGKDFFLKDNILPAESNETFYRNDIDDKLEKNQNEKPIRGLCGFYLGKKIPSCAKKLFDIPDMKLWCESYYPIKPFLNFDRVSVSTLDSGLISEITLAYSKVYETYISDFELLNRLEEIAQIINEHYGIFLQVEKRYSNVSYITNNLDFEGIYEQKKRRICLSGCVAYDNDKREIINLTIWDHYLKERFTKEVAEKCQKNKPKPNLDGLD